jgi:drug/metabolite transporter (DMT)-like permease
MARHPFKTDGTRIGTVLMIFAALFYSGMSISIKLSAADLTVWQTAIGRFALGAGLIPILARSLRFDLLGRQRG